MQNFPLYIARCKKLLKLLFHLFITVANCYVALEVVSTNYVKKNLFNKRWCPPAADVYKYVLSEKLNHKYQIGIAYAI